MEFLTLIFEDMSVHTQLLDFVVAPITNENEFNQIHDKILQVFGSFLPNLKLLQSFKIGGSSLRLFTNDKDVLLSIRIFENGMINVIVEYEAQKQSFTFEEAEEVEKIINKNVDGVKRSQVMLFILFACIQCIQNGQTLNKFKLGLKYYLLIKASTT